MTRPFSDAPTTFMPELYPDTVPIAVARTGEVCAYCEIRLGAIPDPPKPYVRAGENEVRHYHPGCIDAQRNKDAGVRIE